MFVVDLGRTAYGPHLVLLSSLRFEALLLSCVIDCGDVLRFFKDSTEHTSIGTYHV